MVVKGIRMVFIFPEVVIFAHAYFGGAERRFNIDVSNVGNYLASWDGTTWNDIISSVIVISGTWQFFTDINYSGISSQQVRPGLYSYVERPEINIPNDTISSFKIISHDPQGDNPINV
jgi:hypothetical protein